MHCKHYMILSQGDKERRKWQRAYLHDIISYRVQESLSKNFAFSEIIRCALYRFLVSIGDPRIIHRCTLWAVQLNLVWEYIPLILKYSIWFHFYFVTRKLSTGWFWCFQTRCNKSHLILQIHSSHCTFWDITQGVVSTVVKHNYRANLQT